jgi:hypothetical protein
MGGVVARPEHGSRADELSRDLLESCKGALDVRKRAGEIERLVE